MPLAAMLLVQAVAAPPDLVAAADARLAVAPRCVVSDNTDVTVCGRRSADRFRAPLVTRTPDPRDDVTAERTALLHRTNPVQDMSPFLVESGMAGVSAGMSFGASGSETRVRPLAP